MYVFSSIQFLGFVMVIQICLLRMFLKVSYVGVQPVVEWNVKLLAICANFSTSPFSLPVFSSHVWERVTRILGYPRTHCAVQINLTLTVFLPQAAYCCYHRCKPHACLTPYAFELCVCFWTLLFWAYVSSGLLGSLGAVTVIIKQHYSLW